MNSCKVDDKTGLCRWRWLIILAWTLLACAHAVAVTRYVSDESGNDANDGSSWTQAKKTIQSAVAISTDLDVVLVTNGLYALTNQVTLTSGVTVRSVNGLTVTAVEGGYQTTSNRCFYLQNNNAVVDGFTIRKGEINGYGGGVYILTGGTVRNCLICSNWSDAGIGGGIYMQDGGVVEDCTISNNFSTAYGGGVFMSNGGLLRRCTVATNSAKLGAGIYCGADTVSNCVICDNVSIDSGYAGGGIYIYGGQIKNSNILRNHGPTGAQGGGIYVYDGGVIEDCLIASNTARYGGGVGLRNNAILRNCVIIGNSTTVSPYGEGGGVYNYGGTSNVVERCTIMQNEAGNGGGIFNADMNKTARNCLIAGNMATDSGGGVYLPVNVTSVLDNCTIVGNAATNGGGGISAYGGGFLTNCIVYGNTGASSSNYADVGGSIVWDHSCTAPLPAGNSNLEADPRFADANGGNWRLTSVSPCLNTGTNENWMNNSVDLDGRRRIVYDRVDMGCYELILHGTICVVR